VADLVVILAPPSVEDAQARLVAAETVEVDVVFRRCL
jgi:hypothetical protein